MPYISIYYKAKKSADKNGEGKYHGKLPLDFLYIMTRPRDNYVEMSHVHGRRSKKSKKKGGANRWSAAAPVSGAATLGGCYNRQQTSAMVPVCSAMALQDSVV
ncbi:hypothetical protein L484_014138 [Morus notabilis]|uniref:Uncharacterized protein n=1 Tax=Morus notabilis TaxID=981085 RepID=W9RHC6_9ROSA|nr:hypothetical protein L484_014138 [Morus notabilis]